MSDHSSSITLPSLCIDQNVYLKHFLTAKLNPAILHIPTARLRRRYLFLPRCLLWDLRFLETRHPRRISRRKFFGQFRTRLCRHDFCRSRRLSFRYRSKEDDDDCESRSASFSNLSPLPFFSPDPFQISDHCRPLHITPLLLIQTGGKAANEAAYKNTLDAFSKIVKANGVRALYAGALANIYRGVAGAGTLTLYDKFQELAFGKGELGSGVSSRFGGSCAKGSEQQIADGERCLTE